MIKLTVYIDKNSSLDFSFNNCEITYYHETNWVNIFATKQKLTLRNSFIAADETISQAAISANFLIKEWIQDIYKQNKKILIISPSNTEPIRIFWGDSLSIVHIEDDFVQFKIDDKNIWTYGMKFTILVRDNPA